MALAAILAVALALRLLFVLGQRGDPLFDHPVLDEQRYVDAARALAAGRGAEDRVFWQPPGVIYAFAAVFKTAGPGLLLPRLLQALLSTASCLLLFLIGRRLFTIRVGLAAAAIAALHGVLVFESHELLPPTWALFLDLLALLLLLQAGAKRDAPRSFAAGLALGVSAIFAPTILPFALIAAIRLRRPAAVAALLAGVILPIAPVTLRNHRRGGEVVLVSSNGGLNFYLGNNADYRRTFSLRPGRHWEELTGEPARAGIREPGAGSAYFRDKGLAFVTSRPGAAAALTLRKLYLFFHGAEVPRDTDIYAAREQSRVLAVLVAPRPICFPDGLLIPAALAGAAALWPRRRRLAILYAFLGAQAIVIPVFFVTSRHRVPALAAFVLFAAAGAAEIARRWRGWDLRRRAAFAAGAAALLAALNVPTWETRLSFAGELDFYRGLAQRSTDPPASLAAFERAARRDPSDPRVWFELGNTLEAAGRSRDAARAWLRGAELDPWDSRFRRRAALVFAREGDVDSAIAAIQANVAAARREPGHYAPDHLNLSFLYARRGDLRRAFDAGLAAIRADPAYVRGKMDGRP